MDPNLMNQSRFGSPVDHIPGVLVFIPRFGFMVCIYFLLHYNNNKDPCFVIARKKIKNSRLDWKPKCNPIESPINIISNNLPRMLTPCLLTLSSHPLPSFSSR